MARASSTAPATGAMAGPVADDATTGGPDAAAAVAAVTLAEAPPEVAQQAVAPVLSEQRPMTAPPRNGGRYSFDPVTGIYTEIQ